MQRTVQIYIKDVSGNFQRIDLFKDESISITDKIQDVRDIAKVFTEFSQSFSVPASKTNNKLFKHFYNADIVDGFDARKRVDASIEINNIPFKTGKVRLEGVNMMNNAPESYRIVFFGDTVKLKDILGDDELGDLTFYNSLNYEYNATEVENRLTADSSYVSTGTATGTTTQLLIDSSANFTADGVAADDIVVNTTDKTSTRVSSVISSTTLTLDDDIFVSGEDYVISNDVIAPLITHTQRLYYDSGDNTINTGNLHYDGGGGVHNHGLRWDNLKYALRVHQIIQAIENKYSEITFSNDFFNTSNESYYKLFMWLHRNKDYVQIDKTEKKVNTFVVASKTVSDIIDNETLEIVFASAVDSFDLVLTRTGTDAYDVIIKKDGNTVYTETGIVVGSKSINLGAYIDDSQYQVIISGTNNISFSEIRWDIGFTLPSDPPDSEQHATSGGFQFDSAFGFDISQQIPKMKVLDFLTGLFKMFNLTALVESDGTIYVDTLDEFYVDKQSSESPYEIDEYVDSTKHQVDSALPYKEIKLGYEDTGTLLAIKHREIIVDGGGSEWGEEEYAKEEKYDKDSYEVVVPFGHMKFERIYDDNTGTLTPIQWGYSADDNFDEGSVNGDFGSYIGKPLLFYPLYLSPINGGGDGIGYVQNISDSGAYNSHIEIDDDINMPSNSIASAYTTSRKNIHFKNEFNEYAVGTNDVIEFTDTLFKQYYETYITQVFTKSNRIIKLKAFLPLKILLNYTLADKFIYKGRKHQINSITTNITTGESEIELLNIVIE